MWVLFLFAQKDSPACPIDMGLVDSRVWFVRGVCFLVAVKLWSVAGRGGEVRGEDEK